MSNYFPIPPQPQEEDPAGYAYRELQDVANALSEPVPFLQLQVLNVAPDKPRNGMIAAADGTNWDPGSGAGVYGRIGDAWVKLG